MSHSSISLRCFGNPDMWTRIANSDLVLCDRNISDAYETHDLINLFRRISGRKTLCCELDCTEKHTDITQPERLELWQKHNRFDIRYIIDNKWTLSLNINKKTLYYENGRYKAVINDEDVMELENICVFLWQKISPRITWTRI